MMKSLLKKVRFDLHDTVLYLFKWKLTELPLLESRTSMELSFQVFLFFIFNEICIFVIKYNSIQHYVIKFVSDLHHVSGFLWVLRFPPPIKLIATI